MPASWMPKTVTEDTLVDAGIIKSKKDGVRILAKGDINTKLEIEVSGASKAAVEADQECRWQTHRDVGG